MPIMYSETYKCGYMLVVIHFQFCIAVCCLLDYVDSESLMFFFFLVSSYSPPQIPLSACETRTVTGGPHF